MHTILFVAETSAVCPMLAAGLVNKHFNDRARAASACVNSVPDDWTEIGKALTACGLGPVQPIAALADINVFQYDLIVSFTRASLGVLPSLPGMPAVVYWQVGQSGKKGKTIDNDLVGTLEGLLTDLFTQGYLNALDEARKNVELMLDNLHEGILAHDLKRRIFFFNRAAERITGYTRDEVVGRDCHEVFPEKFCHSSCSFCDLAALPQLPERPYPVTVTTRSGEKRQIEMSVVAINNFLANPVGVVASFRDMTREMELASRLGEIEQFSGIIGRDPKLQEIYQVTRDLAVSGVPVMITGESGTGKELVAAAIHNEGDRAEKLFVPVNCGALPENLLESELFGHVKGAFTGAIRDKKGRFELADGGTIFLDEIGDITPAMQVKLLRVLQDGAFQRLGDEKTVKADVRVIAATHKDLEKEIAAGRFREDLFYRLCVVPLHIPPLRERRNDIPLLARHFIKQVTAEEKREEVGIAPETMDILIAYDWPGNVRELQNVIRYMLVRCRDSLVKTHHLPPQILRAQSHAVRIPATAGKRTKLSRQKVEKALAETGGNRKAAAHRLGVGRATLYRFLARHPIEK